MDPPVVRKGLFRFAKCPRVDDPARAAPLQWNADMQHFMKNQIFDNFQRNRFRVQGPADRDGVVGGIITSQKTARSPHAPANPAGRKIAAEKPLIQTRINFRQIEMPATGRKEPNSSASAPSHIYAAAHCRIEYVRHITFARFHRSPPLKKLSEKDFSQRFQHDGGRFRQEI